MGRKFVLLSCLLSFIGFADLQAQLAPDCPPVKEGKICYADEVQVAGVTKDNLYRIISAWAKKNYGKDFFVSNLSANRSKGTIFVSSKVEMSLDGKDKTGIKYRLYITCNDDHYKIEMSDIVYVYDRKNERKFRTYPAEDVILNKGDGNTVAVIQEPQLFCQATLFHAQNIFNEVYDAVKAGK
ncbi:MAG: DUF4468 domain-containing protein [Tannerellaceae bacterium]|nr:DUF4468 domain-containing protein [Tannerellaceae bacterium]